MSENMPSFEEIQQQQQQQAQNEERRLSILDQILEPEAKERLSRLSLVKKDKARAVEDSFIRAATNGHLKGKVTEAQLIAMLEQISGGAASEGGEGGAAGRGKKGVVIQRRRYGMDDDEDDDDSDLM